MLEKGLVSVEFKSKGGRFDDVTAWREKLRPADLYQTLLAAMAVSLEEARPVAPVLRTMNAVYFLHPSQELVKELALIVPRAAQFLESDTVGAKDAADLATVLLANATARPTARAKSPTGKCCVERRTPTQRDRFRGGPFLFSKSFDIEQNS